MKADIKYEPPDYCIVLEPEDYEEGERLRRFHARTGNITIERKIEKYGRFNMFEIRREGGK